jgi:hypothetical protein
MSDSVKVIKAALDDAGGNDIILRGVVDPASLSDLKIDTYQREILPMSKIKDLALALKTGSVPDIELGMRGGDFREREGNFYLQDSVYIIDGLQRRTAALELMKQGLIPRLGATVHFNTDFKSEQEMFRKLNVLGVKLSANVLLRNERETYPVIEMLIRLCHDSSFTLHDRVSWEQRMKRDQLIGGIRVLHTAVKQHSRFLPSSMGTREHRGSYTQLADEFNKVMTKLGRNVVRENIKRFWEVLDGCFNVQSVVYSAHAPYLNKGFLSTLARVFADHRNFWADASFACSAELRKKLSLFPLQDPYVASLCSSSGPSLKILYQMIVDHINSGKRQHRLVRFDQADFVQGGSDDEEQDQ